MGHWTGTYPSPRKPIVQNIMSIKFLRTLQIVILSGLLLYPVSGVAGSGLLITEIMYNLEGADNPHEWVEIFNGTSGQIDLADWRFNDGSNHILNPPPEKNGQGSILIQSGEYVILADDAATFLQDHVGFAGTVIDTVLSLNNTTDTLSLVDQEGSTVASVTYQNSQGADGNGYTLEFVNNIWEESSVTGGTPGEDTNKNAPPNNTEDEENDNTAIPPLQTNTPNQPPSAHATVSESETFPGKEITFDASSTKDVNNNSLSFAWNFGDGDTSSKEITVHSYKNPGTYNVVLMVGDGEFDSYDYVTIVIQEPEYSQDILINEFLANPTGTDAQNEWIELVNTGNETTDLSGWKIDDEEGGSSPFVIPDGTLVEPQSFIVFPRPQTKIALNNDGDTVRLLLPTNIIIHEVSFSETAKEGWAAARFGSSWSWTNTPTPNEKNKKNEESSSMSYQKDTLNAQSSVGVLNNSSPHAAVPNIQTIGPTYGESVPKTTGDAYTANLAKTILGGNVPLASLFTAFAIAIVSAFSLLMLKKRLVKKPSPSDQKMV